MSLEMDTRILLILCCTVLATSAWSRPFYPVPRGPMRFTRFAPPPPVHVRQHHQHQPQSLQQLHSQPHAQLHSQPHAQSHLQPHAQPHSQPHAQPHLQPHHKTPVESADLEEPKWQRPKRGHDHHGYDHHDHDHGHKGTSGVTGPVHTFVKTDKNANYKWGVRHHVGDKYAS